MCWVCGQGQPAEWVWWMAVSSCPIVPEESPSPMSKKSPLGILVSLSKIFTKIQSHPERQLLCFCICALGGVTLEKPRMDLDEAQTGVSGRQSKIYSLPTQTELREGLTWHSPYVLWVWALQSLPRNAYWSLSMDVGGLSSMKEGDSGQWTRRRQLIRQNPGGQTQDGGRGWSRLRSREPGAQSDTVELPQTWSLGGYGENTNFKQQTPNPGKDGLSWKRPWEFS